MRFLADMGVSQRVVEWLRVGGHDVIHLRDEGLQTLPNGEIFATSHQHYLANATLTDTVAGNLVTARGWFDNTHLLMVSMDVLKRAAS